MSRPVFVHGQHPSPLYRGAALCNYSVTSRIGSDDKITCKICLKKKKQWKKVLNKPRKSKLTLVEAGGQS